MSQSMLDKWAIETSVDPMYLGEADVNDFHTDENLNIVADANAASFSFECVDMSGVAAVYLVWDRDDLGRWQECLQFTLPFPNGNIRHVVAYYRDCILPIL